MYTVQNSRPYTAQPYMYAIEYLYYKYNKVTRQLHVLLTCDSRALMLWVDAFSK